MLIYPITKLADTSENGVLFILLDKITIWRAPTNSSFQDKLPR